MLDHIENGHLKAAYGVAGASPMADPDSPRTQADLAALHPTRPLPDATDMAHEGATVTLDRGGVRQ